MPSVVGEREEATPVLIHPGFHKTGTTFLQNEIFPNPQLFRPLWSHGEIDQFVIGPHDLTFDPSPGRADIAERRRDPRPDVIDVVSSETLCANPFYASRESVMHARRLKEIFPKAKILFTVRKQNSIIRATYIQYLKSGGSGSPADFFDRKLPHGYFGFDSTVFEFHRLIEYYADLFGRENVIVLTQETLQRDLDAFVATLRAFCGVTSAVPPIPVGDPKRHGVSPSTSGIPVLRLANRFRPSAVNPETPKGFAVLGRVLGAVAYRQTWLFRDQGERLEVAIRQRFAGKFAASNAKLQSYTPCDLRKLGYEMPKV